MTAAQALCKYSHSLTDNSFFHFVVSVYKLYSTFLLEILFLNDRSFLIVCMLQLTPGCEISTEKYLWIC